MSDTKKEVRCKRCQTVMLEVDAFSYWCPTCRHEQERSPHTELHAALEVVLWER